MKIVVTRRYLQKFSENIPFQQWRQAASVDDLELIKCGPRYIIASQRSAGVSGSKRRLFPFDKQNSAPPIFQFKIRPVAIGKLRLNQLLPVSIADYLNLLPLSMFRLSDDGGAPPSATLPHDRHRQPSSSASLSVHYSGYPPPTMTGSA